MMLHGSLLDVHGVGTLLLGPSGIGKSECALELLSRGHRLVAEVHQHQQRPSLEGEEARRLIGRAGDVRERRVGELGVLAP